MGDLTKDFSRDEFKCKCGCGMDCIDIRLVKGLQALRDKLGKPVIINDADRCPRHNKEVGGAPNSQHMLGRAADIHVNGVSPGDVADAAETIPVFASGGIGRYATFVHVDVRGHKARWRG